MNSICPMNCFRTTDTTDTTDTTIWKPGLRNTKSKSKYIHMSIPHVLYYVHFWWMFTTVQQVATRMMSEDHNEFKHAYQLNHA